MLIAANLTQLKKKEWQIEKSTVEFNSAVKEENPNDNSQHKIISDEAVLPVAAEPEKQPETPIVDATTIVASTEQPAPVEAVGVDTTQEEPKKKTKRSRKKVVVDSDPVDNTAIDTKQPIEKITEDKSLNEGLVGKPITVDDEVQKMIDNDDQQGLEEVYKKIVKELAKKNRSKSTHWGPIKNKNG
jgi:hypothetical protein